MSVFKHHVFRRNSGMKAQDEFLLGVIQEFDGYKATAVREFYSEFGKLSSKDVFDYALNKLVNLNYVTNHIDPKDNRRKLLRLTKDGLEYLEIVKSLYKV